MASPVLPAGSVSRRCQAGIEACMDFLTSDKGHISIPIETSLSSLLGQCLTWFKGIFNLHDPHGVLDGPFALDRILSPIFDIATLAYVKEKSGRILPSLDDHDRLCLYLQGVAGMALIFRRLITAGPELSPSLFSRELQLFAESEPRRAVLEKIGSSSLVSLGYTKNSIVDLLMAAMEEREVVHHDLNTTGEDLLSYSVAWVSGRPCKNMGLPWGFTIMALN
ncbi:hypothetical protein VTK56DRAFT_3566 [Thermocarpiscus australiensis]